MNYSKQFRFKTVDRYCASANSPMFYIHEHL